MNHATTQQVVLVETITVDSEAAFVDHIVADEEVALSETGAAELWDLWTYRAENGADDYLVTIPTWLSQKKFGADRPVYFATVEHDDESKGAVLFADVRTVDPSILEAGAWRDVPVAEVLQLQDMSNDEDSYVDEPGLTWSPRSQQSVFELGESA